MSRSLTFLLPILLTSIAGFLLLSTALNKSPVYDEIIYPSAGLVYWKTGDFSLNKIHPPLQKLISSIPLLATQTPIPPNLLINNKNEWRVGFSILFSDLSRARDLVFFSRLPTILFTLLLACLIFFWGKALSGWAAGLIGVIAFIFDPLVLGNGSLALDDVMVAFFFTAALFFLFLRFYDSYGWFWFGIFGGLAIATKFTGLLLIPIQAIFLIWDNLRKTTTQKKQCLIRFILSMVAGLISLVACYGFSPLRLIDGLSAEFSFHHNASESVFLLGSLPRGLNWIYYPVAILIKTPIPLLLIWGIGIVFTFRWSHQKSFQRLCLVTCLLMGMALVGLSQNRFGIRYLLPIIPILAVLVGHSFSLIKTVSDKFIYGCLLAWLVGETLVFHPHHMAYFNQLVGGPKEGYKWLDGSNQDWGQDLPALASFLKQAGSPEVIMCYCGSGAPEAYGITYQDGFSPAIPSRYHAEHINSLNPQKEFLAVNARLRRERHFKDAFDWLEGKSPVAFLGYTIFVYDITNDVDAQLRLAQIYKFTGRTNLFRRQLERVLVIDPGNTGAQNALKVLTTG